MACGVLIDAPAASIVVARWISTTETAVDQTGAHLADVPALLTELEALGQAVSSVGSRVLVPSPYSARLRPVTNLSRLFEAECVTAHSIQFVALDTTLEASSAQDEPTLTAMTNSITPGAVGYSVNDAYLQARYRNTLVAGWQPNWFRPIIQINGTTHFTGDIEHGELAGGAGDLAIGLDLPFCLEGAMTIGRIWGIEIYAQAAQFIPATGKYQRFPILCTMIFTIC